MKQGPQGNQTVATVWYDIQNRRLRKTVGNTTTYYLYNLDNQLIAEISGSGTVLREYVWLDGEPFLLAEYTGASAGMYFYVNDHLGTPQQLLNGDTGAVAWQAAYLPFGEAQVQVSTMTNNLRFPGQYYDAETGLHYNWNRYYAPKSGRYISTDQIGLNGGVNIYLYLDNNSINYRDISGLKFAEEWTTGGALIGGSIAFGGSLVADTATCGTNIVFTPSEVALGAAIGGTIGYGLGSALDYIFFSKSSKKSGKEKANDVPSWLNGRRPDKEETGREFAERVLIERYGNQNFSRGPGSEFSKIRKYADRLRRR